MFVFKINPTKVMNRVYDLIGILELTKRKKWFFGRVCMTGLKVKSLDYRSNI